MFPAVLPYDFNDVRSLERTGTQPPSSPTQYTQYPTNQQLYKGVQNQYQAAGARYPSNSNFGAYSNTLNTIPPLSMRHTSSDVYNKFQIPEEDVCQPRRNWTQTVVCEYVKLNSANCEGGGYMLWVRYVECTESTPPKIFVIVGGILYMLFMFVMISTAADEFFSPNVAAIVGHLGMSESVAGVTFMAFGNGAPDIFQSIASVLTVPTPKAGLALGALLGGGMFITCMVTSTIVLTDPFRADPFSTVRDIVFYMVAVGFILLVFLYDSQIYIWQPAVLLGLYFVYVSTVVISQQLYKRKLKAKQRAACGKLDTESKRVATGLLEKVKYAFLTTHDLLPIFYKHSTTEQIAPEMERTESQESTEFDDSSMESIDLEPEPHCGWKTVVHNHIKDTMIFTIAGVIHRKEHEPESVDSSNEVNDILENSDKYPLWKVCCTDLRDHLNPFDKEEWAESKWLGKAFWVVKIPCLIYYKATIPHCDNEWSKSVALLHCIISPMIFLFNIQIVNTKPFHGSPGLYAYALVISAIAFAIIASFTKFNKEPWIFKRVSYYLGFLMAISFIYFLASEVVSVVTMIGMVTGLSQELLGLTILAWSNCIGDLISDVAVVKAGMHRMALAAAIGGPLFSILVCFTATWMMGSMGNIVVRCIDLLMGFGIPFLIAKAQGKVVTVAFTPIYHILMLFFAIDLGALLLLMFIQRFRLRRVMAIPMVSIYSAFILMVILTEFNVVVWGTPPPEYV